MILFLFRLSITLAGLSVLGIYLVRNDSHIWTYLLIALFGLSCFVGGATSASLVLSQEK